MEDYAEDVRAYYCIANALKEKDIWQLGISYKKCILTYIVNTNFKPSLLLNNVCIAVVDEVNDLGMVIDSRLTFHTHKIFFCAPMSELIQPINVLFHVMPWL